ncbi:MAG: amidohydrolase, partial [Desulfohalobiaceae bacterium]|nr:amidohydrolase [Desulfohalobiaceae bacterium]
ETRTTERIKHILSQLDVELVDLPGLETGAVGLIRGRAPGPVLGLRADIDALPLQEMNEVPYKSTIAGMMHACGHDAHTAIMLGVAKQIKEDGLWRRLKGTVKLVFQPAEEGIAGAKRMIELGVLDNPAMDRILAGHMINDLPCGSIGWFDGPSHAASDMFRLEIRGQGTHGARPHQGRDPIMAGSYFVAAVQSIVSRNISPMESGVISIGGFHSGTASNIIPATAELNGTVRSLQPEVRDLLFQRLQELADGVASMFGVETDLQLLEGVPPNVNDPKVSRFLAAAAEAVLGKERVLLESPSMGGEDFALFTQRVPGAMIRIGSGNRTDGKIHPLHSPYFDIDEASLVHGVRVFYQAVQMYLL